MKMRVAHTVPLPTQVVKLFQDLRQFTGDGALCFPSPVGKKSNQPISDMTLRNALLRMGYTKEEVSPHGFRHTFSTLANDLGLGDGDHIESALAHKDSNKIWGTYNHASYFEQRRALAQLNGQIQSAQQTGQQIVEATQEEAARLQDDLSRYDMAVADARTRCQYKGSEAVSGAGGDRSGTTWVSYKQAGVDYGNYMNTGKFNNRLEGNGSDNPTIDITFPFKEVDPADAQPGDIYLFEGHMGIRESESGQLEKMLTAHDIRGEYKVFPDDHKKHLRLYDKVYDGNRSLTGYGTRTAVLRYYGCITGPRQ